MLFKYNLSEVDIIAFLGVFQLYIECLVGVLAKVGNMESQVELCRAEDKEVISEELLKLKAVVDGDAEVGGTVTHLPCNGGGQTLL